MKSLLLPEFNATIRYFDIAGNDEVYVYLPGISTPSSSLLHLATHPKIRGHRSLLIDYLGSGHSDKPHDFDYSLQNHAKTIAAVLQHEGLSGCTIIGHSMGGTVGLYLALQNPELVSRLIMAESNIEAGGGLGTRYVAKFTEEAFVKDEFPKMMKQMQAKALQGDPEALFNLGTWGLADALGLHRSAVALVNLDAAVKEAWFRMTIPRSFIIGEKSLPHVLGERLPDAPNPEELSIHGIRVPIIPNSGHMMMVDNPEGFAEAVLEALKL
jgi:pimeloyl-ACP methyl ester carboxylesterase